MEECISFLNSIYYLDWNTMQQSWDCAVIFAAQLLPEKVANV